jgi:hypothetical protein
MLGVVDDSELRMLNALNRLRNKVAHYQGKALNQIPDYQLTWREEKNLWSEFTHNEAMKGDWPEYDASKFPTFLRYIVTHMWLHFLNRAIRLETKRLSVAYSEVAYSSVEKTILPYSTMVLVSAMSALGDLDSIDISESSTTADQS